LCVSLFSTCQPVEDAEAVGIALMTSGQIRLIKYFCICPFKEIKKMKIFGPREHSLKVSAKLVGKSG
jgi:hypothetical protein